MKWMMRKERETGFEPATLSLGMCPGELAGSGTPSQPLSTTGFATDAGRPVSHGLASFRRREAPMEPHGIARAPDALVAALSARPQLAGGPLLRVRQVAAQLDVSTATVYWLIERGELEHVRVSNAIRVAPAALDAYQARAARNG